ncbi:MAG TPA: dockerin type I domain-containing protein [Tepidisphaeraceae bacterium]|nr:dockerin type I domain-containing protein [Tepidisphaeraceae bacterium]
MRFLSILVFFCGAIIHEAYASDTFIDFSKTNNIQSALISQFSSGLFNAANSSATPFDIMADVNNHNCYDGGGTLIINTSVHAARDIYTLINAYAPSPGAHLATVEFIGSAGADEIFTLVNGVDVRDFYLGSWANSINGTTTQNAYEISNVQGGAGTGNVLTGLNGTYHVDEQFFHLLPAFLTQTLTQIKLTALGGGTPVLLGVTAAPAVLGDINDDGKVENADLVLLNNEFGQSVNGGYDQGDFNFDGVVNADDIALFQVGAAEYNTGTYVLPEPAAALPISVVSLLISCRRRAAHSV